MRELSYKQYTYAGFFEHYFKHTPTNPIGNTPEQILVECRPLLPDYIDTVIIFGCSNGRDFIPFQDTFNCVGFDLAPLGYIDWVCNTENLTYYQCSIEDYVDYVETEDLSTSLVYTQGTLMYVSPENQNKFLQHILQHGCKNIIIHEYPPEYVGPHTKFNPSEEYLNLFERRVYREDLVGFIYLDK